VLLSTAAVMLAAALLAAPGQQGSAQGQAPPAQTQTAPPQPAQAPPQAQPQAAQPGQQPTRAGRRTPRPSKRRPGSSAEASFEETRQPRDGGPVQQNLALTANVVAGYDDNLTGGQGAGSSASPNAFVSGTAVFAGATLAYSRGNRRHSFWVDGTGTLAGYPDNLDRPAPGAAASIGARTALGRDSTLAVSERASYDPLFSVISQGAGGAPMPPGAGEAAADTGLFERESVTSDTSASLDRRWSRNDATSLSYGYSVRRYLEDDNGDSRSHSVAADYRRRIATGVRARADYRYGNTEYTYFQEGDRPLREHRIEGGFEVEKQLSRHRQLSLSCSAGATHVASVNSATRQPYETWVPSGRADLTYTLTQDWFLNGGYRRDFSFLYGVTDDVYATDTAFLGVGGPVAPRTSLSVGTSYGNWQTLLASGVNETLHVYGGMVQVRVLISETVAATADYAYYYHRYSNPGALPAGFPAEYDRHAVRAGFTFYFPLAGASPSPPSRR
jgi:hypothetical protein